jgi:DNA-directed RNA polymerase specialized sigma24 family protein
MGRDVGPSFEAFVVARTPALVRTAHAILGDRGDAQDAVQDALVALSRRWRRIEAGEKEAYARAAVVNRCLDLLRQRRRGR